VKAALSRQALWSGALEELERLSLPSFETIDKFEKKLAEAEAEVSKLKTAMGEGETELLEIQGKIESMRLEQEVPTEEDLDDARRLREEGWTLVRKAWEQGEESAEAVERFAESVQSTGILADAYELSVQRADEVADRLRREADRVATKAKLLADQQTGKALVERLKKQLEEATRELGEANGAWAALWEPAGISPLSPREMRAWCQDLRAIAEEVAGIRDRKVKADSLGSEIESHRNELAQCQRALSEKPAEEKETLSNLISKAKKVIKRHEDLARKSEQLLSDKKARERDVQEVRSRAEKTEEALTQWQDNWEEAVRPMGLGRDAVPAQANAVLDELKELSDKIREADVLQKRIQGIDRDAEVFKRKLIELADRVARDLKDLTPEQLAAELNVRLKRARSAKTKQEGLEGEQKKHSKKLEQAEETISEIGAQLSGMCEEAGCSSYTELPEAERRSLKRLEMEEELEELENQLRKLSGGATVDEFVAEAERVDPDGIEAQIEHLGEQIEELGEEKSELDQGIGSERTVLAGMDGSAAAAELAEERQRILGRLETDVEHYTRLRLASAVLTQAIERYREKHQGPILRRTNELFLHLTLGSFEGVRVEFDEQGEPVLVGVRAGGKELVGVEGMSDGSTDQLYLALRLASLEAYLENNEPMPFIVDDILIKFDNERATATLQVLAELSKKTQIVFFTYHRHLVDLAEANIESSILLKHAFGVAEFLDGMPEK
jgi:uncharacterized protein YhaN